MLETVVEARGTDAEKSGSPHYGQGYRQHERRVPQAAKELGIVARAQQPSQGEKYHLVVLPVVQELLDDLASNIGVEAVDGHIEKLDPFYCSCAGFHAFLS